ncbi:MAG: rhomboid family intramembrane serine protease [Bacteroidetes bacterium]|nr:rhomboid family intramembrane serine protease [Bacteroidota bacterium]MBK7040273.1 rhomboid family intramembrane serine protease [Bacteroidota bacterium]MBK7586874.1 rhomboid family intramembrane serine protease [Bacteroidota bacterium]MBK8330471.1 rhomboid family intramembrane serine protease [Bacteroidota bacterium]MBK9300088.1 rhomboid family intramembrane serine protease [Bacteroidota bacterium]
MVTYIIIGITAITSFSAFSNVDMLNRLIFYPVDIKNKNEWWRFITHGFIHADIQHLIFNMLTLYFFGRQIEITFEYLFGNPFVYPVFYLSALMFASAPSYGKHKDDNYYRSLGASGAIAAVLFATILFDPWQTLMLNFFIPIPALLFAVGYVVYSTYMSKKGGDNIGHDAHLWGAVYGLVFPIVFKPHLISYFLEQLKHPRFFN